MFILDRSLWLLCYDTERTDFSEMSIDMNAILNAPGYRQIPMIVILSTTVPGVCNQSFPNHHIVDNLAYFFRLASCVVLGCEIQLLASARFKPPYSNEKTALNSETPTMEARAEARS